MKIPRTGNFFLPSVLLIVAVVLSKSGFFNYPEADAVGVMMDKLYYYVINTVLWLSAAYLVNLSLETFIWGGLIKITSTSSIGQTIKDFLAVLIYLIFLSIIIFAVFRIEYSAVIVFLLLLMLLIGSILRPKVISLVSSKYLSSEHAFNIGDWIELINSGGASVVVGEVFDMSRKGTRLKSQDGSILLIPNNLLEEVLIIRNYRGINKETEFEVTFVIDQSVPVDRAKRILMAGAKQAILEKGLLKFPEPRVVVKNSLSNGIEYAVKYWIVAWEQISPEAAKDKIISIVLNHLSKSGLSLAYPKTDIYYSEMPKRQTSLYSSEDRIKILRELDLFNAFRDDELDLLAKNLTYKTFGKDDELIRQGDEGDSMFVLVEGLLNVYVNSANKDLLQVGQLKPGNFFGEISLLTGEKRSATVKTSTDALVFEIRKNDIAPVLEARKEIIEEISKVVTARHEINVGKLAAQKIKKEHLVDVFVNKIKSFFGFK